MQPPSNMPNGTGAARQLPLSMQEPPRYSSASNLNQSRTRMSSIQDMYTPIRVLNQFSTDWKIRARVTKKDEPRQWKN